MQTKTSIWSRMGNWFNSQPEPQTKKIKANVVEVSPIESKNGQHEGKHRESNDRFKGMNNVPSGSPNTDNEPNEEQNGQHQRNDQYIQPISPKISKRDLNLEKLTEGYNKVIGLVETIQVHMIHQDQRSEQMVKSLENMNEILKPMGDSAQKQVEAVTELKDQIKSNSDRSHRIEEKIMELPKIADKQRETMTAISNQLSNSGQQNEKISDSLMNFETALSGLGQATNDSAEAMKELHKGYAAREEKMVEVLQKQTTRFTWIAWVAIVMAVLSAGVSALVALT